MLDLVVLERWPGFVRQADTYSLADCRSGRNWAAVWPTTRRTPDSRSPDPPFSKLWQVVFMTIDAMPNELSCARTRARPYIEMALVLKRLDCLWSAQEDLPGLPA